MESRFMGSSRTFNNYWLVATKFVSDYAYFLNMILMSTFIADTKKAPFYIGVFLACRVVGSLAAGYVSSHVFRLFPGGKGLIAADTLRAVALGSLFLSGEPSLLHLWTSGFLLGIGGGTFNIGLRSFTPRFIGSESIMRVNSWLTMAASAGMILGSFSGGWYYSFLGVKAALWINVVAYLISAGFAAQLRAIASEKTSENGDQVAFSDQLRTLHSAIKCEPMLVIFLVLTMFDTLGSASHNVGFPFLSKLIDPDNPGFVMGLILSSWALGTVFGALTARRICTGQSGKTFEKVFLCCVSIMSCNFVMLFFSHELFFVCLFSFLAGLGDGGSEISLVTRFQHMAEPVRVPAFSVISMIQSTGFGVGMILCSLCMEFYDVKYVVGLFHSIPIIWVIFFLVKPTAIARVLAKEN